MQLILFLLALAAAEVSRLGHLKGEALKRLANMANSRCKDQLVGMLFGLDEKALGNLVRYTSKNLGEMGDYRGCAKAGSRHILLRLLITPIIPSTTAIGICGPMNCMESDYNSALATPICELLPVILEALNVPLKGRYWVSHDSVEFFDTQLHSSNLAKITPLTIASFVCFGCFLVIEVAAAVLDSRKSEGKFEVKPEGVADKIVCSFSIVRNMKNLVYADHIIGPAINSAYGVLSILMIWLIASHVCLYQSTTPTVNILDQNFEIQNNPMLQALILGEGAMEAIFAVWSFLSTLIVLQLSKADFTIGACIKLMVRNFFRFILVDAMLILYLVGISPLSHTDSPLALLNERNIDACKLYWWQNMLYIANFFPNYFACMEWMSYLGLKYQLLILTIIITFVYAKSKKGGLICALVCFAASLGVQLGIILGYDLSFSYLHNKPVSYTHLTLPTKRIV
eukprot:TRINITY_DN959_c0_g2_i15.p1 TRINITY_DN959_c0_g2~~TRINITY_DN959_c0_g2_i15.p1  ORF type:complete len:455 (+),score=125.51 TRINITY_DN959_c0_g2_i15:166-1530(+)